MREDPSDAFFGQQTISVRMSGRKNRHIIVASKWYPSDESIIGEPMQSELEDPKLPPSDLILRQALDQLRSALKLLDEAHVPSGVGAHVDLAVCRLEDILGQEFPLAGLD